MKKTMLLAISACALTSCLASCGGGIKSTFSLEVKDPIVSLSEAKSGIKIKFAEGYKFLENPKYETIKFTCDQGDKMTFELKGFSVNDPSQDCWLAKTSQPGTYKVSMSIDGTKSANELVLTVKDGQYVDDSIVFPTNIHISFKNKQDQILEFYKVGNEYVSCGENNNPEFYIPALNGKCYYAHKRNTDPYEWVKRDSTPENCFENMAGKFRVRESGEYINKTEGTVTISDVSYNTVSYDFGNGLIYDCIRTDSLSIVYKLTYADLYKSYYYDFEVTAIDTSLTSLPESFNLPK